MHADTETHPLVAFFVTVLLVAAVLFGSFATRETPMSTLPGGGIADAAQPQPVSPSRS